MEPLVKLDKLKDLSIGSNDIGSGLEYLPDSLEYFECGILYETRDAKVKVINEALKGKLPKERKEEWEKEISNLLLRSQDIQKNINQFFGGYSQKEIKNLKDPDHLGKRKWLIRVPQWSGRVASVIGGSLLFVGAGDTDSDYTRIGGAIAIAAPFIETISGHYEKIYYEVNENKWDRFVVDSKQLWNDYHELADVLETFYVFYGDYTKKLINSIERLEEKEKNNTFIGQEKQELADKKAKLDERNKTKPYYSLWKKIQEIYKEEEKQDNFLVRTGKKIWPWKNDNSDNLEDDILVTKNQFAQDLQRNWEDWRGDGRKKQWKEVGEMLVELSNEQPKNTSQQNNHLIIDVDLNDLNKVNVQQQTQAQIIQPAYGTPGSSKP